MGAAKHTPGEWVNDGWRIVCAANGYLVATVTPPDARLRGREWHAEHDTTAANARLIAAAPLLLEALERCVDAIREYGRNEGEPTEQDEEMFSAERAARAAIAAAKGEA